MQEAFRKALDDVHSPPTSTHAGTTYLDVVRVTVGTAGGDARDLTLDKLAYRLEKLTRHFCTYIQPGMTTTARRAELQDDWLPLARRLGRIGQNEQVTLLERYARGILACSPSRVRAYLFRESAGRSARFEGIAGIPGVTWPSTAALLVHSLEELEGCSDGECQELHHNLTFAGAPAPAAELRWLLEELARWLAARRPALEADLRAA